MTDIASITVLLLLTFLGGQIARRFGYGRVIGQLVAGLLIGFPAIRDTVVTANAMEVVQTLSSLGVIMLLFLTGFELDLAMFRRGSRDSAIIAMTAAVVPFLAGMLLGYAMGFPFIAALMLGICLSVTAEGTKVALLLELGKVRSRVGSIMLGAGIIDDIFEVAFLTLVLFLGNHDGVGTVLLLPIKIVVFLAVTLLALRWVPRFVHALERSSDGIGLTSTILLITLLLAVTTEWTGFGAILGAFVAGVATQRAFPREKKNKGEEERTIFRTLAFSVVVPFFFVFIGLRFQGEALLLHPGLTVAVFCTALFGKIIGTLVAYPWVGLRFRQLLLIGWGMNSRGVMELVLAHIALASGLIDETLYSVIVFTAVGTTVLFPIVIRRMLRREPEIMD